MKRRMILWAMWAALMVPFAVLAAQSLQPGGDPDAMVAASGNWATAWLMLAVILTPLARAVPALRAGLWLRRAVGLAAFAGSAAHLGYYWLAMRGFAEPGGEWALMAAEAFAPGIVTGWLALILLLVPALASNDAAMRRLRGAWKPLQRLAWPAAALALLHMAVVHDAQSAAIAVAGLVAGLQILRFTRVRSTRKAI